MNDVNAVPIIRFVDVRKDFKGKRVLNNISFEVKSKEIVGIIGLSGSGKTTLLNLLIGFIKPTQGDVLFHAEHLLEYDDKNTFRSIFSRPREVRKTFGFASQYPSFYSELSVTENLQYFGSLYNLNHDSLKSNIVSLLHLMELFDARHVKAGSLSGGMQRRLDIACALIHDPKVLILDEPTSDLDTKLRKHIWHLLRRINEKGTTIILSSHHLEDLEYACDKIAVIHNNELVNFGAPDMLKNNYTSEVEIQVETVSAKYSDIVRAVGPLVAKAKTIEQDHKIKLYTSKVEDCLYKILHSIVASDDVLVDLIVSKPSLVEVFESLTKKTGVKK
ncbi:ABC transporter ATP-binding protein [Candidatus Woesearchaeota archaeon]|nr:ABC transporter ATP-binding protein [Candidatus Woesearchaeota archaeon]